MGVVRLPLVLGSHKGLIRPYFLFLHAALFSKVTSWQWQACWPLKLNNFNGHQIHVHVGKGEGEQRTQACHNYPWQASQYWLIVQPVLGHEPLGCDMHTGSSLAREDEGLFPRGPGLLCIETTALCSLPMLLAASLGLLQSLCRTVEKFELQKC